MKQESTATIGVRLTGGPGSWELEKDGETIFIKGAAGDTSLDLLSTIGGNVLRSYGEDDRERILDAAGGAGFLVIPGMWLPHERHGFSYSDAEAVEKLTQRTMQMVKDHRDNPDILLWALGNEMEGDGSNVRIWETINRLAKLVKTLDDRPVMTIIAGANKEKLAAFGRWCPDVDILGINAYGGLPAVHGRMREILPGVPYVICEFGARGPWESPRAPWDAEVEQTSSEKREMVRRAWIEHIEPHRGYCLGGFVFRWGWKQEATHTWFGLFLEDGSPTTVIDGLQEAWTGEPPLQPGPEISSLWEGKRYGEFAPGVVQEIDVRAISPDGVGLAYEWRLFKESADRREGGDAEAQPAQVHGHLDNGDSSKVTLTVPAPGQYRLFVTVRDSNGKAATANVPLLSR